MARRALLAALAERLGIVPSYVAASGRERRFTSDATREALLDAMKVDASTEAAAARALLALKRDERAQLIDPVRVVRVGEAGTKGLPLQVPEGAGSPLTWRLEVREEGGRTEHAEGVARPGRNRRRLTLPLPTRLGPGYHALRSIVETRKGRHEAQQVLIVAPASCLGHAEKTRQPRAFGLLVNLYPVRSQRNWGVGDLTDLRQLLSFGGDIGAAFVGINPLHALWNRDGDICPYAPVSRLYRNLVYLDIEAVPELTACPPARSHMASPHFQRTLARLREADRVDYGGVSSLQRPVLELLHRNFAEQHRDRATRRGRAYTRYLETEGEVLRDFATFMALAEHFSRRGHDRAGWRAWPAPYRDPRSETVQRFRRDHAEEVAFHCYVQFELDRQLARAAAGARASGLPIGLYHDLALGTAATGCDPWAFPDLFAEGANVGAPPDDFSATGQDWGFPPVDPHRLRAQSYVYWMRLLQAAFAHAGALRIDHVMGLLRLYWIPAGFPPREGAYVRYPGRDLLGILALESQRHKALVIGEDLGTVPRGLPATLARWGILSSRVLYFERPRGTFRSSAEYSRRALVTANNHDLPPLAGYLSGRDLALRRRAGQIPSDKALRSAETQRKRELRGLRRRLAAENLLPDATSSPSPSELSTAVTAFLCRTPAPLVGLTLDDLVGETDPVNLPGVPANRYPSWQRRMGVPLEKIPAHPAARLALQAIPSDRSSCSSADSKHGAVRMEP
jgi:4-alpha-glucanotransferase